MKPTMPSRNLFELGALCWRLPSNAGQFVGVIEYLDPWLGGPKSSKTIRHRGDLLSEASTWGRFVGGAAISGQLLGPKR